MRSLTLPACERPWFESQLDPIFLSSFSLWFVQMSKEKTHLSLWRPVRTVPLHTYVHFGLRSSWIQFLSTHLVWNLYRCQKKKTHLSLWKPVRTVPLHTWVHFGLSSSWIQFFSAHLVCDLYRCRKKKHICHCEGLWELFLYIHAYILVFFLKIQGMLNKTPSSWSPIVIGVVVGIKFAKRMFFSRKIA